MPDLSPSIKLRLTGAVGLLLACMFVAACADYEGSIAGRVTFELPSDPGLPDYNAAVPFIEGPAAGVEIRARALDGGSEVSTMTDCDGNYMLDGAGYGPNEVFVNMANLQPVLDDAGNIICDPQPTPANLFLTIRSYFVDVREDETSSLDMIISRAGRVVANKVIVPVHDESGNPILGARVDLYRGNRNDYIFVGTEFTQCSLGTAVFFDDDINAEFFAPIEPTTTPVGATPSPTLTPSPTSSVPTFTPTFTPTATPLMNTPTPLPTVRPSNPAATGSIDSFDCETGDPLLGVQEFSPVNIRIEVSAPGYLNGSTEFLISYFDPVPFIVEPIVLVQP